MTVPCGKCNWCLAIKRADWSFRIRQEMKVSSSAYFLTMTYNDEHIRFESGDVKYEIPTLCKRDVQLYLKRLRKVNNDGLRYYAVGEYGSRTQRPHYHVILFNHDHNLVAVLDEWYCENSLKPLGEVRVGSVTPASIHYVTKYVVNRVADQESLRAPPFATMSRRPGIGDNYRISHFDWHRAGLRNFTKVGGVTGRLPRFYKDKMFTAQERERFYQEAILLSDENYCKEIERLMQTTDCKIASQAELHYEMSNKYHHDVMVSKLNSKNKF